MCNHHITASGKQVLEQVLQFLHVKKKRIFVTTICKENQ